MAGFNLSAFERDREDEFDRRRERDEDRRREEERRHERRREEDRRREEERRNEEERRREEERRHERRHECESDEELSPSRLREECIIALKVYDSCRQQDCLRGQELGPARAAECVCLGDETIKEGDVIDPPRNAAAVTIDRIRIRRIIIVDKRPNELRRGFWEIDLKFVFEYRLTFREADGRIIGSVRANSIFNKKVVLFGSIGRHLAIATDLFNHDHDHDEDGRTIDAEPFVLVEAKAVALEAELRFQRRINIGREDLSPEPNAVIVTIGLFTIIKLFRIVNLTVESRGFCIPEECEEISAAHPCDVFDDLDFPLDMFEPPQRAEFLAGISNNIPRERDRDRDRDRHCGCDD